MRINIYKNKRNHKAADWKPGTLSLCSLFLFLVLRLKTYQWRLVEDKGVGL